MSNKLYLINGIWLTWEEAHNLGYTKQPSIEIEVFDTNNNALSILKDIEDNTIYNSNTHTWESDITSLGFIKTNNISLYLSEQLIEYQGYSNSIINVNTNYVLYDSKIRSISDLYNTYGLTWYKCTDYTIIDGDLIVWYDHVLNKYWDNRENKKLWTDTPPKIDSDESTGFENWTLPSPLELSFITDYEEFTESEPLKLNQTGRIVTSSLSPSYSEDLLEVDSILESYELFISQDEINKSYSLYSTETVTFNNVEYPRAYKFTVERASFFEDVDDKESLFKIENGKVVTVNFYYRTDFENHLNEKVYFNEDNLPDIYENYFAIGYFKTRPLESNYFIKNSTNTYLETLYKLSDNEYYYNNQLMSLDSIKQLTDIYEYIGSDTLKDSSSDLWWLDYNIYRDTTSFRLDRKRLLVNLDDSEYIADTDTIYLYDRVETDDRKLKLSDIYQYTGVSSGVGRLQYLYIILRDEGTPANPLVGTSANLYAYTSYNANSDTYWGTKPEVKVKKYKKVS